MRILLVNGPPRSGKDTVSDMIKKYSSSEVHQEKFAYPMKIVTPMIYSITRHKWTTHLDTPDYKDIPCPELFGKTPREVQIGLSESYLKPLHGKGIFGELAVRRIETIDDKHCNLVIMSDSGFYDEAVMLIDRFGSDAIELWRLHRDGCDFKKDSRDYIDLADVGVQCWDIENNGSIADLQDIVIPLFHAVILPRESFMANINEPKTLENTIEWKKRRVMDSQSAFSNWPAKKRARTQKEKRDADKALQATEQRSEDSDSGGMSL